MIVEVELFGQLAPDNPRLQSVNVTEGTTVSEVAAMLNLNLEKVGLITVDGIQKEDHDLLFPDCRLCFFTHMSGG
jgi:molybdopterin converting factor small subunit